MTKDEHLVYLYLYKISGELHFAAIDHQELWMLLRVPPTLGGQTAPTTQEQYALVDNLLQSLKKSNLIDIVGDDVGTYVIIPEKLYIFMETITPEKARFLRLALKNGRSVVRSRTNLYVQKKYDIDLSVGPPEEIYEQMQMLRIMSSAHNHTSKNCFFSLTNPSPFPLSNPPSPQPIEEAHSKEAPLSDYAIRPAGGPSFQDRQPPCLKTIEKDFEGGSWGDLLVFSSTEKTRKPLNSDRFQYAEKIKEIYEVYRSYHPRSAPELSRKSKEYKILHQMLATGIEQQAIIDSIHGIHHSLFHLGDNQSRTIYLSLELAIRNTANIAKFSHKWALYKEGHREKLAHPGGFRWPPWMQQERAETLTESNERYLKERKEKTIQQENINE